MEVLRSDLKSEKGFQMREYQTALLAVACRASKQRVPARHMTDLFWRGRWYLSLELDLKTIPCASAALGLKTTVRGWPHLRLISVPLNRKQGGRVRFY